MSNDNEAVRVLELLCCFQSITERCKDILENINFRR